jgi:hypothetical protein
MPLKFTFPLMIKENFSQASFWLCACLLLLLYNPNTSRAEYYKHMK